MGGQILGSDWLSLREWVLEAWGETPGTVVEVPWTDLPCKLNN